jgi:peptidoglycan/LPS O-acetylase OafA/YrhL
MTDLLAAHFSANSSHAINVEYLTTMMARRWSLILSTLVVTASINKVHCVAAFASNSQLGTTSNHPQRPSTRSNLLQSRHNIMAQSSSPIRGGGGSLAGGSVVKASVSDADPAAKSKKIRLSAFDSMRFFLIVNIVLGHFIRFANPSEAVFRTFSQHNVVVGAFFALSGYVAAYTSTENKQRKASAKLLETPKQTWILQRIFGYLPLHLVALAVFSPIFLYADVKYNGWFVSAIHGLLSVTLTQAWFPQHAEVWNAPTWFLSALNFATTILPFALPSLATLNKKHLRKTTVWMWIVYFLPKLGYLYDLNTFSIFEGVANPKAHPNLALFNLQRFSPMFCVMEVLLGAAACRLVMLDDADGEEPAPKTTALSTLVRASLLIGTMVARGMQWIPEMSDMLYRSVVFLPLFLQLLMAVHRNTVRGATGGGGDPLVNFLSHPWLVALGNLSFPIFIVHGPIGQIFYKKIIATKLFGKVLVGPGNFGLYLLSVLAAALVMQKAVLQNKAIANWSKKTVDQLSTWM